MGARLPPGEAERRAKERAKAFWSGANYKKVAPGDENVWQSAAAAFIDPEFMDDLKTFHSFTPNRGGNRDPLLSILGMVEMPSDFATLKKAYRFAVMAAFKNNGSVDTSPAYVTAFEKITKAYDRLRLKKGW